MTIDLINTGLAAGVTGVVLILGAGWARCSVALEAALASLGHTKDLLETQKNATKLARGAVDEAFARDVDRKIEIDRLTQRLGIAREVLGAIASHSPEPSNGTARRFMRLAKTGWENTASSRWRAAPPRPSGLDVPGVTTGPAVPTDR